MSNKQIFQLSFISICVGTVMWFLFIINDFINILMYAGWLNDFISVILEFGLSFGLILFAVGILQLYKSAQIPSIILITGSALNFIHFIISNYMNFLSLSNIWSFIFTFLTSYFPIIFLLIFILKYNDVKQLKIKIFIAIFGVGIALVGKALFTILIAINPDLIFVEYGRTWLDSGLRYLRFFGLCGGLLMATGALSTLSEKSPEAIKDISQPMSVSDWLITYLIMIVPIVNIVMLFVWGFGSNTNLSKASWAKATLLWFCIITVIYVLFLIIVFSGI